MGGIYVHIHIYNVSHSLLFLFIAPLQKIENIQVRFLAEKFS